MDELYLTDEDIHGCEEDSEKTKLRNENQNYKDKFNYLKEKIEHDIKINKRSLEEEIKDADFKRLLNLWVKYDNELLEILSE